MRATSVLLAVLLLPLFGSAAGAEDRSGSHDEFGLYATTQGRTLDLQSRDLGWADDPRAPSGEVEAGLGWRRDGRSAVLGYEQPDLGPRRQAPEIDRENQLGLTHDDGAVMGVSFALRSH